MAVDAANAAIPFKSPGAVAAGIGPASAQEPPKDFYGSCNGPTGPCLLGIGHEGPHLRPHSPFGGVVTGVRELRAERDKALRLLGTAGKLLRSIQSYGNPGHSFRQEICDQIDALLKEAK